MSALITVKFHEVGRLKRSWEKAMPAPVSEDDIAAEARKSGGLASRCVEAFIAENGSTGEIVVGGFRPVGTFSMGGGAK